MTYTLGTEGDADFIEIVRMEVDVSRENGGPLRGARIVLYDNGQGYFLVHGAQREDIAENCTNTMKDKESFQNLIKKLGPWHHFCCGIPKDLYEKTTPHVPYRPKMYTEQTFPFPAVYTMSCDRWFHSKQPKTFENGLKCCAKCSEFLREGRKLDRRNSEYLEKYGDLSDGDY